MQDRTLRTACVAMTIKIDAIDRLEKRVKSRFAPREIVVPLPKDVDQILQFLNSALARDITDGNDNVDDGKAFPVATRTRSADTVSYWMHNDVQTFQSSSCGCVDHNIARKSANHRARSPSDGDALQFHQVAKGLLHSPECKELLQRYSRLNRVIEPILRAVDFTLGVVFAPEISGRSGLIGAGTTAERLQLALKTLEKNLFVEDTLAKTMESVSAVELALLAALRRIKGKATFADVLRVYETLGREEGLVRGEEGEAVAGRIVAEKCWERLVEGGLVLRSGTGPKVTRTVTLAVSRLVVDQVIEKHAGASTRMVRWAREEVLR